ncbi:AraC family transcriptional regulator [Paenibacillus radicis (ex Xue et al. 2023)]|uniref:AraC family transcriptional regulator n=1 Tax=Paenibacillus radicis (ex Xue et al. 2023) TaxID=2972489 RepID=A0ABT1YHR4_9BACL|nr:AraC family transcriptional regulator [Paenibacillus radicis (ex Xue et al. 2023)]MCR8632732.1 AraC family transcriptional regulator [Paenibacillus radicis (ex Xue et al. 2023)]
MTRISNSRYFESADFPFHIAQYPFRAEEMVEPHSHEFVELVYVAEGSGRHDYRGDTYRIYEGDVFVIEPDAEHSYKGGKDPNLTVYNVLFAPSILSNELQMLSTVDSFVDFFYVEPFLRQSVHFQSHLNVEPHDQLEMKHLLGRILSEYKEKKPGYRLLVKTRLIELFVFLSRCYDRSLHRPMTVLAPEREVMKRMVEFIETHHARPLSLDQVSRLCSMSQSSFTAKFKQHIGKTFIEYRNEARIAMAKKLLLASDAGTLQIAGQVGFDDLSFFNKVFKQLVGVTPGQFRRAAKAEGGNSG